jgi:ATPase subunit of ABC transporter with duplicated ATPase domains
MGKRSRFEDILDLEDELSWRTEKEPNNRADGDSDNDEDTVVVEEPVVVKSSKKNKKPLVSEEPEKRQRERGDASSRMNMLGGNQPAFVSCKLQDVMLNFGSQQVLKNASWEVKTGDRVGLVGANGGGKSSQLKMLIGDIEASAGEIVKQPSSLKLAFLRQEFYDELDLDRTLKEELMSVFTEETKLMEELAEVEKEIETTMDDVDKMQEVIERVTDLQVKAEKMGVSLLDSKVEKCIDMMGFAVEDSGLPVSAFSGGWKMRIGLGKILLQEPNILLLDEPTNHLDLETVGWLENFLKEQSIPMVIVSHDREFLNQVATKIVDCENGETTTWEGNYEMFMKQKAQAKEKQQKAYEAQQKKLREAKQFINQNKMTPSKASQVSRKQKVVDEMSANPVKRPWDGGKPFVFRFPLAPKLNEEVSNLSHMTHGYGDNHLFNDVTFRIQPGERIAFLGPNGAGKSTLLRLVLGFEKPLEGKAGLFHRSVIANYFEQNQADALDLTKTVLQSVEEAADMDMLSNDLRALLGKFLFKGDAVHKKVESLSGGEKARLSLCLMMLRPANVIVLDEPTNHLDIPAKEMLEEALQHFDGTVLIVSHDRYFVSQTATTIVDIQDQKLVRYEGDYRYYLEKHKDVEEKVSTRYIAGSAGIQSARVIDQESMQKQKQKQKMSKHLSQKGNLSSGKKGKGVKNAKRSAL